MVYKQTPVFVLAYLLVLSGCATMQIPKYPVQSVNQYKYSESKDGISIAIHPITNKEESNKYFGTDLLSSNILAILVLAKNVDSSSSFVIDKKRISIVGLDNQADRAQVDTSGRDALAIGGALLISPVGVILSHKMSADSDMVRHNFATKELKKQTVSLGKSVHGFVYFNVPDNKKRGEIWNIHIEALKLKTRKFEPFDIKFQW